MSAVSPGLRQPRWNRLVQTVKKVSGMPAASAQPMPLGSGRHCTTGAAANRRAQSGAPLAEDPEPLLYAHEPLYRDGHLVGINRIGAFGFTLGGSVGLAMIEDPAYTSDEAISSGTWELEIVGRRYPVSVSLLPMYDPKRERIKA